MDVYVCGGKQHTVTRNIPLFNPKFEKDIRYQHSCLYQCFIPRTILRNVRASSPRAGRAPVSPGTSPSTIVMVYCDILYDVCGSRDNEERCLQLAHLDSEFGLKDRTLSNLASFSSYAEASAFLSSNGYAQNGAGA